MKNKNYFEKLSVIDVTDHTKKKNGLTYLSWAWAWAELLKVYPNSTYEILRFENNLPYVFDVNTGYMIFTKMTIEGITREMWLPVMNGANKAMNETKYKYATKYGEKTVEAATMFDINKTIMRCLVKNIAMFGLGLYIYAGEDLPERELINNDSELVISIKRYLKECKTKDAIDKIIKEYESDISSLKQDSPKLYKELKAYKDELITKFNNK